MASCSFLFLSSLLFLYLAYLCIISCNLLRLGREGCVLVYVGGCAGVCWCTHVCTCVGDVRADKCQCVRDGCGCHTVNVVNRFSNLEFSEYFLGTRVQVQCQWPLILILVRLMLLRCCQW